MAAKHINLFLGKIEERESGYLQDVLLRRGFECDAAGLSRACTKKGPWETSTPESLTKGTRVTVSWWVAARRRS